MSMRRQSSTSTKWLIHANDHNNPSKSLEKAPTNKFCHLIDTLHLNICDDMDSFQPKAGISYLRIDDLLFYDAICDDFGPMSLGTIFDFCDTIASQSKRSPGLPIALLSLSESRIVTNSIFLIGAYMILKLNMSTQDVEEKFRDVLNGVASYREICPGKQNFHLYVEDCWAGLFKAKSLRLVDFGPEGFDSAEYKHFENPLNADLHDLIPGKFVAMCGPKNIDGPSTWQDVFKNGFFSHRYFSPQHYLEIMHQFDIQAVVRLNAPEYDSDKFESHGIAVANLQFEDCTCPPVDVVAKFMMIAEGLQGAIAVHGKAGLGRTGTLIALYMMKHLHFSAREAIGWIRIVRPGSIIGPQQQFLCDKEALMHRAFGKFQRMGPILTPSDTTVQGVSAFIMRVHEHVDQYIQRVFAASVLERAQSFSHPPPAASSSPRASLRQWSSGTMLSEHVSSSTERRCGRKTRKSLTRPTSMNAL